MELKKKNNRGNEYFWKSIEEKRKLNLSCPIKSTKLTECLQLIEEGTPSNDILAILSSIPEAENFAKFWICKAKLLASKCTFDVTGLYEEAIKKGATPIQELREVVLNICKTQKTAEGVTSDPLVTKTNRTSVEELANKMESGQSCLSPKEKEVTGHPTSARQNRIFTLVSNYRLPQFLEEVEWQKCKTWSSARIERAVSHYPEMLQEHDLVVASLNELLEVEETVFYIP